MKDKELTLLEAFEKVKDRLEIWDCSEESNWEEYGTGYYECEEELDIIENALKDYERRLSLAKEYKDVNNVAKRLKALEIIKNKFVIPAFIMNSENVEEYNRELKQITFRKDYEIRKITQEEYDLLKEVLE